MATKQRLLDCALEELERGGVAAFSLRSVSAAAGLTPMAVYRHYPNKEELLRAAGVEAFAAWQKRAESIRATDPLEWLRQAGRLYVQFALDEPARFDACFVLKTGVERRYPRDFRAGKSPVVALTVARIEAAQADGYLAAGDALEIAMIFWAQLHGLVMLQRSGRMSMSRPALFALAARSTDCLLAAFRITSNREAAA
ncbi:MAG: TetR/AcrR family transcriptional regulator [Pseudomonadota bacterium]